MKRRIFAGLTALLMCSALAACADTTDYDDDPDAADAGRIDDTDPDAEPVSIEHIRRSYRDTEEPMGEEGTWTIFVYLCGSDLESSGGYASTDLSEMMNATENEKYRFVVQTGGANSWSLDIDSESYERYEVQSDFCKLVDTVDADTGMGESSTLADFLEWGIAEYPADNMGLILWNHGSGSINGVCFDQNFSKDSLLLRELDAALYSVYDDMTEPFEFIGFDACLMATAEVAATMATHARYMVASQEVEPGSGWDYTALGNYLAKNPEADGAELGKAICDSFYDGCKSIGREKGATLSVTDLSRIDDFIAAFDSFSQQAYALSGRNFTKTARAISKAENFGGNNFFSGYTNMVDTAGLMNAAASFCNEAGNALNALKNAVIYQTKGKEHKDACGLSMYYPLRVQGSQELSIYKDVALSGYYLALVDRIAYGAAGSGDPDSYDNSYLIDEFTNYFDTELYTAEDGDYIYEPDESDEWDYMEDFEAGGAEISFETEPNLDEDGSFWFTLDADSLDMTDYIEAGVARIDEDEGEVIWLGMTGEVYMDWETGTCSDAFDHYWFCLPDGQYLSAYLWAKCEEYDIYTSPIKLNGEDTYLRFAYDEETCDVWILDIWDGVDEETGAVGRCGRELEAGDIIVPLYDAYSLDTFEDYQYIGDEYEFDGDTELYFQHLEDGVYEYCFYINDIYGDYYMTDSVYFTIDGEDIYFSEEP